MPTLEQAVQSWSTSLGSQLISVVRHGPPDPPRLLIVLSQVRSASLQAIAAGLRGLRAETVFFTPSELEDSRDVFPLELLEAKAEYQLLHGTDVLAELSVPQAELRLQIEEDLKTQRTWLRQRWLDYHQDQRKLQRLPFQAFATLPPVLRGMLRWKEQRVPPATAGQLQAASEAFGLELALLEQLAAGQGAVSFDRYADLLDQLIAAVENN